jgi:hypothetical protein
LVEVGSTACYYVSFFPQRVGSVNRWTHLMGDPKIGRVAASGRILSLSDELPRTVAECVLHNIQHSHRDRDTFKVCCASCTLCIIDYSYRMN